MELEILRWIDAHLHGCMPINQLIKYISILGNGGIFWVVLCVLMLFFKKTRTPGLVAGIALAVEALIVNGILKTVVNRTRPFVLEESFLTFYENISLALPKDSSFPSGHTGTSFVCAFVFWHFFKKKGIIFIVLATLISLSRIFLCVHFPTDVLGAFAIALVCAVCTVLVYERVVKPRVSKYKSKSNET